MTPRQRDRYERILAAAAEEFLDARDDVNAVDAVAVRSGTSKATIYRYFTDKTGLERAMVAWLCARAADPLRGIKIQPGNARSTLIEIGDSFVQGILNPRVMELHRYVVSRAPQHPELGTIFWQAGPEATYAEAGNIISQLDLPGHLDRLPPRKVAEFFINMLTSSHQLRYFCEGEPSVAADDMRLLVRQAVDAMGLGIS
jgi:AcrR family transcriptional regulator